jgi:hypothetical protein
VCVCVCVWQEGALGRCLEDDTAQEIRWSHHGADVRVIEAPSSSVGREQSVVGMRTEGRRHRVGEWVVARAVSEAGAGCALTLRSDDDISVDETSCSNALSVSGK